MIISIPWISEILQSLLSADIAYAYIDPNTSQTIVSSLGAILAAIGAGFVFIGAFFQLFLRKFINFVKTVFRQPVPLGGIIATLAVVIGAGYFLYQSTSGPTGVHSNGGGNTVDRQKSMIILGIDGMDPKLVKEFMDQGKLPNFKRLAEQGEFKPLMTVNPVQSPVVWATMATGVGPGIHGITDFITRKENGYIPELSLVKHNDSTLFSKPSELFSPPVDPQLFFWEKLASHDVKTKVIRWPLTFPAAGVKSAKVLSGLGTPDLLGGMGTYTLFTTDPNQFPQDAKGSIVKLTFTKGLAKTVITGPKKSGFTGVSTSELPLTLKRTTDDTTLEIAIGSKSMILKKNDLSPWIPLAFPIGFGNKLTGMVQFLVVDLQDDVHLYMSPVQIDPLNPAFPIASDTYGKELAEDIGRFHTLGMAEDTNALADEIIDEDQFIMICDSIMDDAEHMFFRELAANGDGFFSFVFDTLDRVQHMFWRFLDPEHPLYDTQMAVRYGKVIEDYYRRMDGILGRVLEMTANQDTTLLVVSDHGFTTYRRNFHVNAWLIEHGYMTLKDGKTESEGLFASVDWSRTKAFALGFSQIFINVKGRDEHGIVEANEVAALKKEIAGKLTGTIDGAAGKRSVARTYDTTLIYGMEPPLGPDLLVGMERGYRFSWQTAVGAVPAFVFEDNDKRWSGDHCVDPEHVPGVIFSSKKLALEHPSVIDIAPTALDYFGVDRMKGMIGKNLFKSQDRHARKTL